MSTPVSAATVVSVPVDGVIYGTPGQVYSFASGDVPPEFVGWSCDAAAATDNNGSAHPNNDLIVVTGDTTIVIPDVESNPGGGHSIEGKVTLGETIVVSVKLGGDGVTSGGFVISFTCEEPAPVTTTTTTTPCPTGQTPGTLDDGSDGCIPDPQGPTTTVCPTGQTPVTNADGSDGGCGPTTTTTTPCPTGQTPGTLDDGSDGCIPGPQGPTTISVPPPKVDPTTPDPKGPAATLPVTGTSTTYLFASGGLALLSLGVGLLAATQILGSKIRSSRTE